MSTIEDFEDAPVGATATNTVGGRAVRVDETCWLLTTGACVGDELMAQWDFTLDPSVPTTAREAIDLAWELAHPVKEGQAIPKGIRYLRRRDGETHAYTARYDFERTSALAPEIRTLDPLPDPEPDWLDAPAVLARLDEWDRAKRTVFIPARDGDGQWIRVGAEWTFHWNELHDVTPLYPKEDA